MFAEEGQTHRGNSITSSTPSDGGWAGGTGNKQTFDDHSVKKSESLSYLGQK